ncbi:ATP-grasp domain-containing protein [Salinarimonas ramus]|uniref:Glutathione synthase n=1 Tax=Salinarimonas ramus TaxID=690164 RepID=A0A917QL68_9HYPH|nr:alpha-L-glutamate ligase [Salinarimonas ramus]GGK55499.1 glutathione synthase [Salinarimonas ramus]
MTKVHVIHENDAWVVPLREAFAELGTPYEEWFLDRGVVDLRAPPPEGVFYNRMSASSHTRDHRFAAEYTGAVLAWLERHGRTIVNDGRALRLEVSKVAQYEALAAHGLRTPDTLAVVGRGGIQDAAAALGYPLILKHNRGGKGLGVRLFLSPEALAEHLASADFEEPIDGITLVQRYVKAPAPFVTRLEFVGGRFLYAVRVDTSEGFELCPADACAIEDVRESAAIGDAACPAVAPAEKFSIVPGYDIPEIPALERFLEANGVGIAGIEVIEDEAGTCYVYDVNTNTNYNPQAEARAGLFGMRAIARHLDGLLAHTRRRAA